MNMRPEPPTDEDAEIDDFVARNRDYINAELDAARLQMERGEGIPVPPLEEFLAMARRKSGLE